MNKQIERDFQRFLRELTNGSSITLQAQRHAMELTLAGKIDYGDDGKTLEAITKTVTAKMKPNFMNKGVVGHMTLNGTKVSGSKFNNCIIAAEQHGQEAIDLFDLTCEWFDNTTMLRTIKKLNKSMCVQKVMSFVRDKDVCPTWRACQKHLIGR